MNRNGLEQSERRLRLLVAIASYGMKNLEFLRRIIQTYQSMAMDVDVVVLSEAPKNLGDEVKVIVGLPSRNPWSLPFGHKPLFAENAERYDLFIYSEDDMEATQKNIEAFLRIQDVLQPDEIAGFLRYEVGPDEMKLLTDAHAAFHWKPESVRRHGDYTFAEFTNEHAGFYVLTQVQLRKAIASGGFLRSPHHGRYGLPETAATDPYTCCGFHKVICISSLEDFLIHHMSNAYVGRHGLPLSDFKEQIQTLMDISGGMHPAATLCGVESKVLHGKWSKSYYEPPNEKLSGMIPGDAKSLLSIGCGWGDTERKLKERGLEVTALPLDSVIGAAAARRGVAVVYGTLEESLGKLAARKFDCVLITHLLHLQPDPGQFLERCASLVREGGTLLVTGPNFDRFPALVQRVFGVGDYRKLRNFDQSGISICGPRSLADRLKNIGLRVAAVRWCNHALPQWGLGRRQMNLGKLTAEDWILQARR